MDYNNMMEIYQQEWVICDNDVRLCIMEEISLCVQAQITGYLTIHRED
jgi:hypothetical protein